jgi:hypothetical protein
MNWDRVACRLRGQSVTQLRGGAVRSLPVATGWVLDVSNDATETTRADVTRKAKALGERGRCT